jgi:outer membrane lipoprotein carrier protein
MKRLLTAVVIAASATASWADGLKSLEAFMKNSQAGRAEFTQAVHRRGRQDAVAL